MDTLSLTLSLACLSLLIWHSYLDTFLSSQLSSGDKMNQVRARGAPSQEKQTMQAEVLVFFVP